MKVFNIRTWLQLALLPSLVLMLGGISAWLIVDMRREILRGFDQKLVGVSAVVAATIDPADHAWLIKDRTWDQLVYDPATDVFLGEETTDGTPRWVALRASDGVELPAGTPTMPAAAELQALATAAKPEIPRPEGDAVSAWDSRRERWVEATEQLRWFDPAQDGWVEGDFAPALGREESAVYIRYVEPMQRIRQRVGLTYLYTQKVISGGQIRYGLDAAVGEDHSSLLYSDVLPEAEVPGVEHLLAEGVPHLAGLQRWELWGLMKSGFVPIFDESTGKAVAMAGTDVEVSMIEHQTRRALLAVFTISILVLVVASVRTLRVAGKLRLPVEILKRGALRQAAGEGGDVIIRNPSELRALAGRVNAESAKLQDALARLNRLRGEQTYRNDTAVVDALLPRWIPGGDASPVDLPAGVTLDGGPGLRWTEGDAMVVVWLAGEASGRGDDRFRSDLALRINKRLGSAARSGEAWPAGLLALACLRPTRMQVQFPVGAPRPQVVRAGSQLELSAPGSSLVLRLAGAGTGEWEVEP